MSACWKCKAYVELAGESLDEKFRHAFIAAAISNHAGCAKLITSSMKNSNMLMTVLILNETSRNQDTTVMATAIQNGSYETFACLVDLGFRISDRMLILAIECGQFRIFDYLRERQDSEQMLERGLINEIKSGRSTAIDIMIQRKMPLPKGLMLDAAKYGRRDIVVLLLGSEYPMDDLSMLHLIFTCGSDFAIFVLKVIPAIHSTTLLKIAKFARSDVLATAIMRGCPVTPEFVELCAGRNDPQLSKFLFDNGHINLIADTGVGKSVVAEVVNAVKRPRVNKS